MYGSNSQKGSNEAPPSPEEQIPQAQQEGKARYDQSGKFKMPVDFYKRILELEKEIDKLKEKSPEPLLTGLTKLYS